MVDGRDDCSLGELFAELARETTTLVRQEVELARTELSQQVTRVARDAAALLAGGAVVYAGILAIIAAMTREGCGAPSLTRPSARSSTSGEG